MDSILNEICKIRKEKALMLDRSNKNRYRIVTYEEDHSKTAYYFSVPIYNEPIRKLLDLKFQNGGRGCFLIGSSSTIEIADSILLKNQKGVCQITIPNRYLLQKEQRVCYQGMEMYPTTNGVALRADLNAQRQYCFRLTLNQAFYQLRGNNKCVALMSEKFKPFVTVSCIGALYQNGVLFAPAEIKYQKINDKEFDITLYSHSIYAKQILFEVNMHETKLFQDTTVESKNPKQNNAFGGTAFIGHSNAFGEQWLYARPDFSILNDLFGTSIQKAHLYIPILRSSDMRLKVIGLTTRFCSFGSTWDNKKSSSQKATLSELVLGYHKINITNMITQNQRLLTGTEGWIIQNEAKGSAFSAISTGDSFYAPQILEVGFR